MTLRELLLALLLTVAGALVVAGVDVLAGRAWALIGAGAVVAGLTVLFLVEAGD